MVHSIWLVSLQKEVNVGASCGSYLDGEGDGDCRKSDKCIDNGGLADCVEVYEENTVVCTTPIPMDSTGQCFKATGKCSGNANTCIVSLARSLHSGCW